MTAVGQFIKAQLHLDSYTISLSRSHLYVDAGYCKKNVPCSLEAQSARQRSAWTQPFVAVCCGRGNARTGRVSECLSPQQQLSTSEASRAEQSGRTSREVVGKSNSAVPGFFLHNVRSFHKTRRVSTGTFWVGVFFVFFLRAQPDTTQMETLPLRSQCSTHAATQEVSINCYISPETSRLSRHWRSREILPLLSFVYRRLQARF